MPSPASPQPSDASLAFAAIEERYVVGFLKRNPVTSTYLGGDALSGALADTPGELRDHSEAALAEERRFYEEILAALDALPDAALTGDRRIDASVMRAQIAFMLRQTSVRRHHHRCLDTYMAEPFRGVDWQIQAMADLGQGRYGTRQEWLHVIQRVRRIPSYLKVAEQNLAAGAAREAAPDPRMLAHDGLETSLANAAYFEATLPGQAARLTQGQPWAAEVARGLQEAGAAAARAQRDFRSFLLRTFYEASGDSSGQAPSLQPRWRADRFAMGEAEYDWALSNNLRQTRTAKELFEASAGAVEQTRRQLIDVARRVDESKRWRLPWDGPDRQAASTRAVMSRLGEDHPRSDDEMIAWYRRRSFELVEYGRRHRLFDVPEQYRLDVVVTPPVLRQSIDGAAYYPAPPFRKSGVGRFYVSPTDNDEAHLRENNRAGMADLCAHEGFPGHDWHYQFMRGISDRIGRVRWLTPGAVEDSSSMWADSMMSEGWALYAEQLMAEPQPGAPEGVYSPEERLYQLQGQLLRDARVRIDTGIHTGRMSFDEAVEYYTGMVDFLPGACARASADPEARASCETARRALFRYSKWPTQAITYALGKQSILDLRARVKELRGARFDPKGFHEQVLGAGTIPLAYVQDAILQAARPAP